jgi:hypothetical protein
MARRVAALDISGRHARDGRYRMVCAAIDADVNPKTIEAVDGVHFAYRDTASDPSFDVVTDIATDAVAGLEEPGVAVAERGEFYDEDAFVVEGSLRHEFKYVETIGERKAVETAHHAAYAARNLLLQHG